MLIQKQLPQIFQKAIQEQWSYPQVFEALKDAGIRYYETDVANYKIKYVGDHESFMESGPNGFKAGVGSVFNQEEVIQAIRRSQRREIDYPTFLKQIAAAGVPHYRVDMAARTVSYFGHDAKHQYVEKVPVVPTK